MSLLQGGVSSTTPEGESVHQSWAEYEYSSGRLARLWYEEAVWAQRITPDFQFEVGCQYLTLGGRVVTIVEKTGPTDDQGRSLRGYECVRGDDDIWRYSRSYDSKMSTSAAPSCLGRTTGSSWDRLTNLIPVKIIAEASP